MSIHASYTAYDYWGRIVGSAVRDRQTGLLDCRVRISADEQIGVSFSDPRATRKARAWLDRYAWRVARDRSPLHQRRSGDLCCRDRVVQDDCRILQLVGDAEPT